MEQVVSLHVNDGRHPGPREETGKQELWQQLVAARLAAGLTQAAVARRLGVSQAQVARIEKRGYEAYTLTTLRRYVQALGDDFTLQVAVRRVGSGEPSPLLIANTSPESSV